MIIPSLIYFALIFLCIIAAYVVWQVRYFTVRRPHDMLPNLLLFLTIGGENLFYWIARLLPDSYLLLTTSWPLVMFFKVTYIGLLSWLIFQSFDALSRK
jgi:hypothetical protein